MMKRVWDFAIGACLLVVATAAAQAADWTTPAEAAHFKTTPSYADTRAYLEKLAAAAPDRLRLTRFGVSP